MKTTFAIIMTLLLAAVSLVSGKPVLADDPPNIVYTTEDILGYWQGTNTIDFSEGYDINWDSYLDSKLRVLLYQGEIIFTGFFSYTAKGVVLNPNGSFSGKWDYTSNVDGSYTGTFTVDGTINYNGGRFTMNCRQEYTAPESIHGSAKHVIVTFNGIKEGTPAAATAAPPETTADPVDFGRAIEKGRINYVNGKAYIKRDNRIIEATVGEMLLAGDELTVDEGGEMTIEAEDGGRLKLIENTRFQLPGEKTTKKVTSTSLSIMVENYWTKVKNFLAGESFEVKECTATAGVRG